MKTKPKYFEYEITGINQAEVDKRVAAAVESGDEIIGSKHETETLSQYAHTQSIGRSKRRFEAREERHKFITRMRRLNNA